MSNKTTYQDLILRADKLFLVLDELGIWPKSKMCRFHQYRKFVSGLDEVRLSDKLDNFLKENSKSGEALFASNQLYEIDYILEAILALRRDSSIPTQKEIDERIGYMLSGPNYTKDENEKNSLARNYQSELRLAARLFNSGYTNIQFGIHPDVLVTINNRAYAIECKRIISRNFQTIIENADLAIKQLIKYKHPKTYAGIVALDVSPFFEKGENLFKSTDEHRAEDGVHAQLEIVGTIIENKSRKISEAVRAGDVCSLIMGVSCLYKLDTPEIGWMNEYSWRVLVNPNSTMADVVLGDFKSLSTFSF